MDKQWHYIQDGAQYGPVDELVITEMIRCGELPTGTPVVEEGSKDWEPARNHACFQVEIYLKKKKASVKAAEPTPSKAASRKPSQTSRQTAQKSGSTGTSQSPKKRTDESAENTPSTAPKSLGTTVSEKSDKLKGKSTLFGDVMMGVDRSVGQTLDTLGKGKPDNSTLSIFTADTKKPILIGGIVVGVIAIIALMSVVFIDRTVTIPNSPEAAAAIEDEIRKEVEKPEGELTKADLERVRVLNLENKQITDVSPLAGLTQLNDLGLGSNKLTNEQLKHLAGLVRLKVLDLRSNQLTDLSTLVGLTQLRTLDLSDNPKLTRAEISRLEIALPKCRINHDFN